MQLAISFLTLFLVVTASARNSRKPAAEKVSNESVAAPVDHEVCFSPGGSCDVKLWKFMQSAKTSLDIAVYDLTHTRIVHEIAVASKRIPTRVVVDRRQSKGDHSLVSVLIKAGVPVRFGVQRGIMHNKFTLVDGKRLETGSFNYTEGATFKNQENQIYLAEPSVVETYRQQFEAMWKASKPAATELARGRG